MATYDLGKVVGEAGEKGDDGSSVWNTSTAPTYANSKYTFTISNLSGKTGLQIAVNDIIFYSTYYYIVSAVNTTTVDCSTRVSIKGSDASVTIVDNLTSDSSTSVLSAKQGKVLNTNKIETSAIATSFGSTTSDSKVPSEKLVKTELDKKIATSNTAGLVKNDGTIDTNTYLTSSSLSNYVAKSETSGLLKNDGTVDTNSYSTTSHTHGQVTSDGKVTSTAVTVASGDNILITDYSDSSKIKRVANILAGHVKDSTAHSNIGSSANDTQATINSDIDTALSGKQATLVSGTNIKTVNNESLLGSGNITIQGGSSVDVVTSWEATLSDTKVPSEKLVKNTIDGLSIPTKTSDLNNDSNFISTSNTTGLIKNDGSIDTTSYSTFSGSYSDLSNKPTIPSASSTTPSADTTSGSYGSGTSYARSNHTHPKSSLYAESSHTHTKSQITDFPSLSTVATSGSYSDLSNKPSYTATVTSSTTGAYEIGTINVSGSSQTIYGKDTGGSSVDIVTAWESTPSDSKVASEKLTKDSLDGKANSTHEHYGDEVFSSFDLSNLGIFTDDSQDAVNLAINNAIGNKISKSQTVGLVKNDGSIDTNTYLTSSAITGMLTSSDIANNLTTTTSGKVLDARQGKALADLIGQAIAYINQ